MKPHPLAVALAKVWGRMMLVPGYSPLVYLTAGGPMLSVQYRPRS